MTLFESRIWLELRDCPGRIVYLAYVNVQLGYTRLIRKGSTNNAEKSLAACLARHEETEHGSCEHGFILNIERNCGKNSQNLVSANLKTEYYQITFVPYNPQIQNSQFQSNLAHTHGELLYNKSTDK
jgi:hypothetical protein